MADRGSVDPVRRAAGLKGGHLLAASRTPEEHAANMERARAAQDAALAAQADPDGTLAANDPEELARRVKHLRRARMADLALKSAAARRAKAAAAVEVDDRVAVALELLAQAGVA